VRDFIFNPFFTTREHAAGIGLSKAQQVARDHGGEIGIEDNEEAGATVYLELPLGAGGSPDRV
jgi:signal transduction histidine kinase